MSELELAQSFLELAQTLDAQTSVDEALNETIRLAVDAVHGAEMAGISWLVSGKRIETPVFTDKRVAESDSIQYELKQGPAIDATLEGHTALVNDLSRDEQWPKFSRRAAELGLASLLSCQLISPRRTLGALNIYATEPDAFDDTAREIAEIYAAHASIVLASRQLESDLRTAVDSRGTIGQAMGILVERHKIVPGQAFDMLVQVSQNRHMKLRDVAAYVVETGTDPAEMSR